VSSALKLALRLGAEQRAATPAEWRLGRRDAVRLMVIERETGAISHTRFDQIGRFLSPQDLLVLNTSRVVPSAVPAIRADGERIQLRAGVRRDRSWDVLAVFPRPPFENLALQSGERLRIGEVTATVRGRRSDIPLLWRIDLEGDGLDALLRQGEPIRYSYVSTQVPLEAYQTVFATRPGSAESPSAGRPFSWQLLERLAASGVRWAEIVLHTGLSSLQDDAADLEHHLTEEWYEVPAATARASTDARRVIAVGTTVVRALETAARDGSGVRASQGWTDLRIGHGTPLRAVDALLTGFHEPQASHLQLLEALLAPELLERAYKDARERGYLWHEFGDVTLIV
jgi:S-adenosylmethionine:tRNA ribosyltransferase-isomerase